MDLNTRNRANSTARVHQSLIGDLGVLVKVCRELKAERYCQESVNCSELVETDHYADGEDE